MYKVGDKFKCISDPRIEIVITELDASNENDYWHTTMHRVRVTSFYKDTPTYWLVDENELKYDFKRI